MDTLSVIWKRKGKSNDACRRLPKSMSIQKMAFTGGFRLQKVAYMPLYTKIASTPPLPWLVTNRINAWLNIHIWFLGLWLIWHKLVSPDHSGWYVQFLTHINFLHHQQLCKGFLGLKLFGQFLKVDRAFVTAHLEIFHCTHHPEWFLSLICILLSVLP